MSEEKIVEESISTELLLEHEFNNPQFLVEALTHKSFAYEQGSRLSHNEKLEFLGDAVLDLILSAYLMEKFPEDSEGNLSKKRASLVNESVLSKLSQKLGIDQNIRLGRGELSSQGRSKPRLLASAYEAILGAVFLDAGYSVVDRLVRDHFQGLVEMIVGGEDFAADYKTKLQEMTQADIKCSPVYAVVSTEGPSHSPQFEVSLSLQGQEISRGVGRSKKIAEQEAARLTLAKWEQILKEGYIRRLNG